MLEPTAMVMVELPAPGAGMGFVLRVAIVPGGTPEAESVMALLKPPLIPLIDGVIVEVA